MEHLATQHSSDLLGARLGSYRVVRELGRGGMGVVYEAIHDGVGQRAAVKVLSPACSERPELVARFLDEARVISLAQHPGLVKLFDFSQLPDGTLYLLMELLEGESLWARLERQRTADRPLDPQEALRIARQLAATLAYVHEKGVLHRDLKPDNVFLVPDPEAEGGERAKLLDFGIAKLAGRPREERRTSPGTVLGTPLYMSPEHFTGADLSDRSDVYSLGVLLFEMLAGAPPFSGDSLLLLMERHARATPPPLPPACPPALGALVRQMLEKDAAARPAMAEVAARLGALSGRPSSRDLRGRKGRGSPREGLRRALLLASGAALALGAGALLRHRAPAPRPGMVLVPGAAFPMGSEPDEIAAAYAFCQRLLGADCARDLYEREQPLRRVLVSPFLIDAREVSNGDFATWLRGQGGLSLEGEQYLRQDGALLADLYPSYAPSGLALRGGAYVARRGFEHRPVTQVTWVAALRYCRDQGKRLPTEAEWELAARGPGGNRFPWGDDEPRCGAVSFGRRAGQRCAGAGVGPLDVGQSPQDRTPLGVLDLGGNVAEWVADSFRPRYPACAAPCRDPLVEDEPAPDGSDLRVVRGGAWAREAEASRATGRMRWPGNKVTSDIGFRCAASAPEAHP